ncbi:MAG: hypothetical protein RLZZ09_1725 [Pseudomonadota bacterium]|jgi:hypothetical protein
MLQFSELSSKQRGVAKGMALAVLTSLAGFTLAHWGMPALTLIEDSLRGRLTLLATALLLPGLTLMFCVGRLANHRFFTPADIDGSAFTEGTPTSRLLQSLLQNTLEQVVLALIAYVGASLLLPFNFLSLIPAAALMFLAGRILFFRGYAHGAASRAYGFALTFYSTVLLMVATGLTLWV